MGRRPQKALRIGAVSDMLIELKIRNLAVVEDAVIPFGEGLNVITGSTGAGKSIILSAVDMLSGERARRALIRRGAENLTIEGIFVVPPDWTGRKALGMEPEEEILSVKREVAASGKNRVWINGTLSSLAASRELTTSLFELHGQHRQQELLDQANHIRYLDSWGDYDALLRRVVSLVEGYNRSSRELARLENDKRRHEEQEEFLRYQFEEMERLDLTPGLEGDLERRLAIQTDIHTFVANLESARSMISEGEESALDRIGAAERLIDSLVSKDETWTLDALREAGVALGDISRSIGRALGELEDEPEDIEGLQERLASIQRLRRKYHLTYDELLAKRDELGLILRTLESGNDAILEEERRREEIRAELLPLLGELTERRRAAAAELDRQVTAELEQLGMKGALFQTRISKREDCAFLEAGHGLDLSPRGWDEVEFRIRTNIGEDVHPLAEIASGGELSRITLVLKRLQAEERGIPTLIFDEIDAGLGADLGGVVAERLKLLADRYQIICITHLAQVASKAGNHVRIEKRVHKGRTMTTARALSGEDRIEELARMLGGEGELRERLAAELLSH
jgi:DNA repair protein RecN (Recombination protein N)